MKKNAKNCFRTFACLILLLKNDFPFVLALILFYTFQRFFADWIKKKETDFKQTVTSDCE